MQKGIHKKLVSASAAWSMLVAASVGTLVAHHYFWASTWYAEIRWLLAVLSFASGLCVLAITWPSRKALAAVLAILATGQLWLLQVAFARMAWSMNGLAT